MPQWPPWWLWELDVSAHLLKRMIDRRFNETDLREMLQGATDFAPAAEAGRFIIRAKHHGRTWKVVVEPGYQRQRLVVVTAYPVTVIP